MIDLEKLKARRKRTNEKHRVARRAATRRIKQQGKEFIQRSKENSPCQDCGQCYPSYVMDFDHVRGEKVRDISDLVYRGASIATLDAEMQKCDLVCSNCHRERTHQRK